MPDTLYLWKITLLAIDSLICPGNPDSTTVLADVFIFIGGILIGSSAYIFDHFGKISPIAVRFRNNCTDNVFSDDFFVSVPKKLLGIFIKKGNLSIGTSAHNNTVNFIDAIATFVIFNDSTGLQMRATINDLLRL